jgi:hypothetical protein
MKPHAMGACSIVAVLLAGGMTPSLAQQPQKADEVLTGSGCVL